MPKYSRVICLTLGLNLLLATVVSSQTPAKPPTDPFARWEKEIAALETAWQKQPPDKGGILFTGSSSMRLWKTSESFPEWNVINSGFGGSQISDVNHFVGRIVLPHEPRTIVFYAGDNDIASKVTPEKVRDNFREFSRLVHEKLPKTEIYWLPIKPSLKRWSMFAEQKEANRLVAALCESDPRLHVIDTVPAMLNDQGEPRPELFVKDGLHLSPDGYKLWDELVKSALSKNIPPKPPSKATTPGAR